MDVLFTVFLFTFFSFFPANARAAFWPPAVRIWSAFSRTAGPQADGVLRIRRANLTGSRIPGKIGIADHHYLFVWLEALPSVFPAEMASGNSCGVPHLF